MSLQVAGGSILGRDHLLAGKNNQDAYYWSQQQDQTIAVVCDGCGSSKFSEVGAQLAARLLVASLSKNFLNKDACLIDALLERTRQDVLAQFRHLVNDLGGSFSQTVENYFLFTVLGLVVNQDYFFSFSLGDGLIIINEELQVLPEVKNNAPTYLGYALLESEKSNLRFVRHPVRSIQELRTALIATDGLCGWEALSQNKIPGKEELVGPISQFWTQDKMFSNPDMVRRRLALMNREVSHPDWKLQKLNKEPGLLKDDSTLVVIRHRMES